MLCMQKCKHVVCCRVPVIFVKFLGLEGCHVPIHPRASAGQISRHDCCPFPNSALQLAGRTSSRTHSLLPVQSNECTGFDRGADCLSVVNSSHIEEMAAAPGANIFGLTQYDGLTSFFGDQTFDYDGYMLPQVGLSVSTRLQSRILAGRLECVFRRMMLAICHPRDRFCRISLFLWPFIVCIAVRPNSSLQRNPSGVFPHCEP